MTPGGFHSFEHRWALAEAFRFHRRIGKARVEGRIEFLATRVKESLIGTPSTRIITPLHPDLSAGLVCFEVAGRSPQDAVARLRRDRIVATVTPYNPSYVRVGPGIVNTRGDVDRAMAAVSRL
jgi:isopenicillin-N epimerase